MSDYRHQWHCRKIQLQLQLIKHQLCARHCVWSLPPWLLRLCDIHGFSSSSFSSLRKALRPWRPFLQCPGTTSALPLLQKFPISSCSFSKYESLSAFIMNLECMLKLQSLNPDLSGSCSPGALFLCLNQLSQLSRKTNLPICLVYEECVLPGAFLSYRLTTKP